MRTNRKFVLTAVGIVLLIALPWIGIVHWGKKFFEDDDCFGEVAAEKRYVLRDSFENVCNAARRELLSHGGKVYQSDSRKFEGSILLDGMDCSHASLTIRRDKRNTNVDLVIFDTEGWHDFQFLKGKPEAH